MHEALRGSTVVRIVRHSRAAALYARLRHTLRRLGGARSGDADESSSNETTEGSDTTPATPSSVVAGSLLLRLFARIVAWIEGSWLYRWLTAEPDPDVIVIDLRETRIVGPILAALDWFIARLSTTGDSSLFAGIARRGYRLTVDRPVQLLSAFFGGIALVLVVMMVVAGSASTPLVAVAVILAVTAAVGSRISWSWTEVRETRPVQLLVAAFEPPEPPERQRESDDANSKSADRES